MRYEIRLVERLGPLMSSTLKDVQVTGLPSRTVLMATGAPDGLTCLLHRLQALGIEVGRLRVVAARQEPIGQSSAPDCPRDP
jgi:hypothetical protein